MQRVSASKEMGQQSNDNNITLNEEKEFCFFFFLVSSIPVRPNLRRVIGTGPMDQWLCVWLANIDEKPPKIMNAPTRQRYRRRKFSQQ